MERLEYSLERIDKVARQIAKNLRPGDVVAFEGNIATGKTTLIQAILKVLNYPGRVNSPTFVLEHRYPLEHKKIRAIVHLDLYRLTGKELDNFDWSEYRQSDQLVFVEWPAVAQEYLPPHTKKISLKIIDDKIRRLTFSDNFGN
ncbi:MAG TPA: tRNA (adenosine(37)-N6)-threonylcarbamoyltransferase complex ATPase subunit type 1 TsaE [Candidatus Saccharimonadales bacterium]|nr:tRNA (adenosine(37)-N6)-threonylcarbamoyltransferase complex ATPase subunit type 1 TsaE [Candidatus Saccharimonadales bacterium]